MLIMEHHFDVKFAVEHGFAAAVIFRHLQFWIAHNKANSQNNRNGRTWTFNSVRAFRELFPYLKAWDVRKAIDDLLRCGILIDRFGKRHDRTTWYAFEDEKTALESFPAHLRNTQMDLCNTHMDLRHTQMLIGADKEPDKEPDNKRVYSQKGLSKTEDQERGYSLLLRYGIHAKTAKAIIYEQHTPAESIEEVIKNGLAKQLKEPGWILQPGYIVEALNRAGSKERLSVRQKIP